jgi:hypothetical protein
MAYEKESETWPQDALLRRHFLGVVCSTSRDRSFPCGGALLTGDTRGRRCDGVRQGEVERGWKL